MCFLFATVNMKHAEEPAQQGMAETRTHAEEWQRTDSMKGQKQWHEDSEGQRAHGARQEQLR